MDRLFQTPISTSNLYTPDRNRLRQILDSAFDRDGNLVIGSLVSRLETQLCDYHQAKYCVTFSTGFWALVAAVQIQSLPGRSEVIIPSLTYRRLADVLHWAGKIPVMVDVDRETLAVCCDAVTAAVSDETALILAVHPIVNCCDVIRLLSVSEQRGVPLIFDAVESVHETINSRRIGSFGVGEVFSFHASKLINGCEGGYVCTNDRKFRDQLVHFKSDPGTGINGVLCDGHAALAIAGLEEIETNLAHNRILYETYQHELRDFPGIRLLRFDESEQTSFKNVVAEVTDDFGMDRDDLVSRLNVDGILARAYYYPALHAKTFDYDVKRMQVPIAHDAMHRFINLPCGQMVSVGDVVSTCRQLKSLHIANKAA
ncbi:MAG: aminotransferase [Pirellulaceae bacterium]|nr:aminotransferase [Pirellulaceae bacterium]